MTDITALTTAIVTLAARIKELNDNVEAGLTTHKEETGLELTAIKSRLTALESSNT